MKIMTGSNVLICTSHLFAAPPHSAARHCGQAGKKTGGLAAAHLPPTGLSTGGSPWHRVCAGGGLRYSTSSHPVIIALMCDSGVCPAVARYTWAMKKIKTMNAPAVWKNATHCSDRYLSTPQSTHEP
jgi:hypothetical protein